MQTSRETPKLDLRKSARYLNPQRSPYTALAFAFPSDSPRSGAIFFVIAGPLVHDCRPFGIPVRRSFIVNFRSPFQLGGERAESRTFRKIEGNYLPQTFIYRFGLALNKILRNLNNHFSFVRKGVPDFWNELQLEVNKLVTHMSRGWLPALDASNRFSLHPEMRESLVAKWRTDALRVTASDSNRRLQFCRSRANP